MWKYKTLSSTNGYSYKELYYILDNECDKFFSFISQFIHGHSYSTIKFNVLEDDYYPIYSQATVLMRQLITILGNIFPFIENEFITYYNKGVYDSIFQKELLKEMKKMCINK